MIQPPVEDADVIDWHRLGPLQDQDIALTPLQPDHAPGIREALADGDLWQLWYTSIPAPDAVEAEIARRLGLQEQGSMMPFVVQARADGRVLGMTTFMNMDPPHRRLEIGSTWYRLSAQRTSVNTRCKLLLLSQAFDVLGCNAVEFRTSSFNFRSRAAIERLGAKLDGVLRNNQIVFGNVLRDTYVYSIIATEWPAVRQHLQWKLQHAAGKPVAG